MYYNVWNKIDFITYYYCLILETKMTTHTWNYDELDGDNSFMSATHVTDASMGPDSMSSGSNMRVPNVGKTIGQVDDCLGCPVPPASYSVSGISPSGGLIGRGRESGTTYTELDGDSGFVARDSGVSAIASASVGHPANTSIKTSMYSKWAPDVHNVGFELPGFPSGPRPNLNVRSEPSLGWSSVKRAVLPNAFSPPKPLRHSQSMHTSSVETPNQVHRYTSSGMVAPVANTISVPVDNLIPPPPTHAYSTETPDQVHRYTSSGMVYPVTDDVHVGDYSIPPPPKHALTTHAQPMHVKPMHVPTIHTPTTHTSLAVTPVQVHCYPSSGMVDPMVVSDAPSEKIVPRWASSDVGHPAGFSLLSMRRSLDSVYYLSVPDVFRHVTLGGRLSNDDLLELGKLVAMKVAGSPYYKNMFGRVYSFDKVRIDKGGDVIHTNKYDWNDYPYMASACLSWMTDHPEKVMWV